MKSISLKYLMFNELIYQFDILIAEIMINIIIYSNNFSYSVNLS